VRNTIRNNLILKGCNTDLPFISCKPEDHVRLARERVYQFDLLLTSVANALFDDQPAWGGKRASK